MNLITYLVMIFVKTHQFKILNKFALNTLMNDLCLQSTFYYSTVNIVKSSHAPAKTKYSSHIAKLLPQVEKLRHARHAPNMQVNNKII